MKKLFGLVFLWLFIAGPAAAAENFSYKTQVTYTASEQGVQVEEKYTVTNKTARAYLTELQISTPTNRVSGVLASYSDGQAIPTRTASKKRQQNGLSLDYQEITLKFPRANYGLRRSWSFTLEFAAEGLLDTKGSAHTVYIPSIDAGSADDEYEAVVDVPTSFGTPHFSGAQASQGGVVGDRQRYTFTKQELVENSLALAFGDATVYRTNLNFPLHNTSPLPRKMTITLPPDLGNQRVYVESLNPRPSNTKVDEDGNVLAEYWLRPGQKMKVETDVVAVITYLNYDLSTGATKQDIPRDLVQKYTGSTRYWPTGGEVAKAAAAVTDANDPTLNNVRAIYRFVIDKLTYNDEKVKFNIRQGADKALKHPQNAVCLEYSDLMIAMLRSQGIPARMPVGYAYSSDLKKSQAVSESLHSWVEAYVPGIGWMSLDPTWGEKFDQFGRSDLDRFAFAVWGREDERPVALMSLGRDLNYQYESAELEFEKQFQDKGRGMQVNVTRFLILPFLWLERASIEVPAGAASDSNWLEVGHQRFNLGSLAPYQQVTQHRLNIESRASLPVKLTRGDQAPMVMAAAAVQLNYWPLIALTSLAAILFLTWAIRRARLHRQHEEIEGY